MSFPLLQAHRGVSSDYPENTMVAFRGAIYQGYGAIELDPRYTSDGEIVILHDEVLNRVAREPSGEPLKDTVNIKDITLAKAREYDLGSHISRKYKGEKIPTLSEVLEFSKESGILIKIDNRIERFPSDMKDKLFDIVRSSGANVAITLTSVEFAKEVVSRLPAVQVHYDGKYSEQTLIELSNVVPSEALVVWLPMENENTSWVKSGYATREMCDTVRKYAKLGLWTLSTSEEYKIATEWGAYIVETNGRLKPETKKGILVDTHIHSEFSHDSTCPIEDIANAVKSGQVSLVCLTDHCDIQHSDRVDYNAVIRSGMAKAAKVYPEGILVGTEIGESIWNIPAAERIIYGNKLHQVIGSVHAVREKNDRQAFSGKNFSTMTKSEAEEYIRLYFEDVKEMLETMDIDILAHLTVLFRYTNGKYALAIDCKKYESQIREILKAIIQKKIALEINTSCLDGAYDELVPEEWIIALYRELGGHLVTLASDAHIALNIGHGFDRAIKVLKKYGFEYVCYFKNRYICQYTI